MELGVVGCELFLGDGKQGDVSEARGKFWDHGRKNLSVG